MLSSNPVVDFFSIKFAICYLKLRCFFQPFADFEGVIHTFVWSQLDYCNYLYIGISQSNISCLQLAQNTARLLTGTRKCDHISPIWYPLHWPPFHYKVDFKILLFKTLSRSERNHLSGLVNPYTSVRFLKSSEERLLVVPGSWLKLRGYCDFFFFFIVGPKLWISLLLSLILFQSDYEFKS